MKTSQFYTIGLVAACALSLAACGGSDEATPAVDVETPPAAAPAGAPAMGAAMGAPAMGAPAEGGERPDPTQLLERMDRNGDGKLALQEVQGRLAENFDTRDTDGDGFITIEELGGPAPQE